jgi:hypothetical protein
MHLLITHNLLCGLFQQTQNGFVILVAVISIAGSAFPERNMRISPRFYSFQSSGFNP